MTQNENRPKSDKNSTLNRDDESGSSIIQEHLLDKNHVITDEDIRNMPIEPDMGEENEEGKEDGTLIPLPDQDPDEENKRGLDSPWNIFS
jgi:hypothetical protein